MLDQTKAKLLAVAREHFASSISHAVFTQHSGDLTRDVISLDDVKKGIDLKTGAPLDAKGQAALAKLIGKPKPITQKQADQAHKDRMVEATDAAHAFLKECEYAVIQSLRDFLHKEHHAAVGSAIFGSGFHEDEDEHEDLHDEPAP
jgi:myo-inositol-1-phosphate synthase